MHVAIIGSGPIAQGAAALLSERGHTATLWSPRGSLGQGGPMTITTAGLAQITTDVAVAAGPEAVADADVVMFALRGNGHRAAMDAVLPDYLWRFRPSGQYDAIKASARNLRQG